MLEIDGQPWFVAMDICRCLGLASHPSTGYAQHLRKLSNEEVAPSSVVGSKLGKGMHAAKLISESGLYKLVMRSDKPAARKFQDWVTRSRLATLDVLPTIRKAEA
ncbi:MAG: BRO family protein [Rhizobium sp.]|nr:BRO family protein [Rhizobium sp.]MCZ8352903.1 BRO family protein [Rhizobium sp.]